MSDIQSKFQIKIISKILEPSADEFTAARQLVDSFEEALASGRDRGEVDARIVEQPPCLNAMALLERARN